MKIIKIGQISNDGSQAGTVINPNGLCFTICACTHGYAIGNILVEKKEIYPCRMVGRNPLKPTDRTKGIPLEQRFELIKSGLCGCLTTVQKDNLLLIRETSD